MTESYDFRAPGSGDNAGIICFSSSLYLESAIAAHNLLLPTKLAARQIGLKEIFKTKLGHRVTACLR